MAYKIINIKDICNSIGEDKTREILSSYKCEEDISNQLNLYYFDNMF